MGFWDLAQKKKRSATKVKQQTLKDFSLDFIHKSGCSICPLNKEKVQHPSMQPDGSKQPVIYVLGEAPGRMEDAKGRPFIGPTGSMVRERVPDKWRKHIRWSNCVRTRPPNNRNPSPLELECCRPSVEEDIIASKPKAIFGFGNVPLKWALGQSRVSLWHGRRAPININGKHACWFFSFYHPSFISRTRRFTPRDLNTYGSSEEFAFAHALKQAFAAIDNLREPEIHSKEMALADVEVVQDFDEAMQRLVRAYDESHIGIDYETNRLRPYEADSKILTVAIAGKETAFAFPLHHSQSQWSNQQKKIAERELTLFLNNYRGHKISHHLAFELEWSAMKFGMETVNAGTWDDSESQAYILDERRMMHNLNVLCILYFGLPLKSITSGGGINPLKLDDAPLTDVLQYNAVDAKYHRLLYLEQLEKLHQQGLSKVYREAVRRVKALALMQTKGMPVDQRQVRKLDSKYSKQLQTIERDLEELSEVKKFAKLTGHDYRPAAWQDVSVIYKQVLKADIAKTNEATISQIKHPITRLTLRWRKTNKSRSTYVLPLLQGDEQSCLFPDGRIHPVFLTCATRTWRTSSEGPNAQNFPKHEKIAKEIRGQIRAKSGYKVYSFDYAGIQARNVAMESKDRKLVEAYRTGYDVHSDWRDRILKICPQWIPGGAKALKDPDIAKEYRQKAKNKFVFATFFGAQEYTLSNGLGIPEHYCTKLLREFWHEFPDIKKWHERLRSDYYKYGYVTGLSGHRRRAPISENQLINAPIQADESIIVCDAIARLTQEEDERLWPNIEVHDDLTFIWPVKWENELAELVIDTMLYVPYEWAQIVPIEVEMSVGDDWGSMSRAGTYSSDKWK